MEIKKCIFIDNYINIVRIPLGMGDVGIAKPPIVVRKTKLEI
jgi:hypothetical protein